MSTSLRTPTRSRTALTGITTTLALAVGVGVLSDTNLASAEPSPEAQREQVRDEKQAADAMLEELTEEAAAADAELAEAQDAVRTAQGRLANATQAAKDARQQAAVADGEILRIRREGAPIKAKARKVTVDSFVNNGIAEKWELFDGTDPGDAIRRDTMRTVLAGDAEATMEALRANEEDLVFAREQLTEAQQRAASEAQKAAEQVTQLDTATKRQHDAVAQLEEQIDQLAIRSDELRAIDAKLTKEIDRQNAEFAARLRAAAKKKAEEEQRAEAAAAQKAAAMKAAAQNAAAQEAATQDAGTAAAAESETTPAPEEDSVSGEENSGAEPTRPAPVESAPPELAETDPVEPVVTEPINEAPAPPSDPPPTTNPPAETPDPAPARPTPAEPAPNYDSPYYVPGFPPPPANWSPPPGLPTRADVVTVGGITVHRSIAENLRQLLAAAAADGIVLRGGGYRDLAGQLGARRANCGSSAAAIWLWSSSSCHPPTARPGTSQHQKGLAIDFTYNGATICFPQRSSSCGGNPGFEWLKANAARFGFYNLPSEAWHWSTTGN